MRSVAGREIARITDRSRYLRCCALGGRRSIAQTGLPPRAVKLISRSQWNGGFGAHSGPPRTDPRTRASRPVDASKAVACYVRNTSFRAVCFAQIADIGGRPAAGKRRFSTATCTVAKLPAVGLSATPRPSPPAHRACHLTCASTSSAIVTGHDAIHRIRPAAALGRASPAFSKRHHGRPYSLRSGQHQDDIAVISRHRRSSLSWST